MKIMKAISAAGMIVGLTLGGVVLAAPANAAVCPTNPTTPRLSGTKVYYGATSYCTRTGSSLEAFLQHYYAPPLIDVSADNVPDTTGPNFSAYEAVCDNPGSTTFYTRSIQYGASTKASDAVNSAKVTVNHC